MSVNAQQKQLFTFETPMATTKDAGATEDDCLAPVDKPTTSNTPSLKTTLTTKLFDPASNRFHAPSSTTSNAAASSASTNSHREPAAHGKYKLIRTLGSGNFAKVKLGEHVETGKQVAVKVIEKSKLNKVSRTKLHREIQIMKMLNHPNIDSNFVLIYLESLILHLLPRFIPSTVRLYEVLETENHVYLVMEYVPNGEVFDYLVNHGRMKEPEARIKFRQLLSAVEYCHQKQIVHRDLKAENLLLDEQHHIRLVDFGFSNYYDGKSKLNTFCGSPPYAAPELFKGLEYYGPEVDVWSLGVILYTLVSGSLPFDAQKLPDLQARVMRGKYRVPFYLSQDCEMLLRKLLVVNPKKRQTLESIMSDVWVNTGFDDNPLKPYREPSLDLNDPVRLSIMEKMGYPKPIVQSSLSKGLFDNFTTTYHLLGKNGTAPAKALTTESATVAANDTPTANDVAASSSVNGPSASTTNGPIDVLATGKQTNGDRIDSGKINNSTTTTTTSKSSTGGVDSQPSSSLSYQSTETGEKLPLVVDPFHPTPSMGPPKRAVLSWMKTSNSAEPAPSNKPSGGGSYFDNAPSSELGDSMASNQPTTGVNQTGDGGEAGGLDTGTSSNDAWHHRRHKASTLSERIHLPTTAGDQDASGTVAGGGDTGPHLSRAAQFDNIPNCITIQADPLKPCLPVHVTPSVVTTTNPIQSPDHQPTVDQTPIYQDAVTYTSRSNRAFSCSNRARSPVRVPPLHKSPGKKPKPPTQQQQPTSAPSPFTRQTIERATMPPIRQGSRPGQQQHQIAEELPASREGTPPLSRRDLPTTGNQTGSSFKQPPSSSTDTNDYQPQWSARYRAPPPNTTTPTATSNMDQPYEIGPAAADQPSTTTLTRVDDDDDQASLNMAEPVKPTGLFRRFRSKLSRSQPRRRQHDTKSSSSSQPRRPISAISPPVARDDSNPPSTTGGFSSTINRRATASASSPDHHHQRDPWHPMPSRAAVVNNNQGVATNDHSLVASSITTTSNNASPYSPPTSTLPRSLEASDDVAKQSEEIVAVSSKPRRLALAYSLPVIGADPCQLIDKVIDLLSRLFDQYQFDRVGYYRLNCQTVHHTPADVVNDDTDSERQRLVDDQIGLNQSSTSPVSSSTATISFSIEAFKLPRRPKPNCYGLRFKRSHGPASRYKPLEKELVRQLLL